MVSHSLTLIHTDKQAGPTAPGVKGSDIRIHKDSQGHTGTHRDSQGLTGTHNQRRRGSRGQTYGFTRIHRDTQGLTGTRKDSQGLTGTLGDSQGLTRIHRDSRHSHSLTLIHTDKQAGPTAPEVKWSATRFDKDSQGHTGTQRDSQGHTGTHRDSRRLTGTHKDSQGLTAFTLTHTDSH